MARADAAVDPGTPLPITDDEAAVLRRVFLGARMRPERAVFLISLDEEDLAVFERVAARLGAIARRRH